MSEAHPTGPATAPWSASALAHLEQVCTATGCNSARDEGLGRHTSMGVGGPTPLMVWPRHPEALAEVLSWCAERGLPWRVLGGGTNVLVSEAGVDEPVVKTSSLTEGASIGTPITVFPAGVPTAQALKATLTKGLRGMVWATGLPGTIGGAAAGNAGCWGGQMADVVAHLDVIDAEGEWHTVRAHDLRWRYRSLELPRAIDDGYVIVAVAIEVAPGDAGLLAARVEQLHDAKRQQQPIGARNAGCIFKNPDPDHPAGMLIDRAGCKGTRVGDAQVSELHGNFLVNHGNASSADVEELIRAVQQKVLERFGIALEEEIHRW